MAKKKKEDKIEEVKKAKEDTSEGIKRRAAKRAARAKAAKEDSDE